MEPTDTISAVKKRVVKRKPTTVTTPSVPTNTLVTEAPPPVKKEEKKEKPSCQICLEPYNKVANTEVKCCFCEKSSCRRCIQTYLTSTTSDAHCLHCKRAFDRDFIDDNLTATFRMGEYKNHRENILLDREIALMPATQYRAEQIKQADTIEKEIMPPINQNITELSLKQAELQKEMNKLFTQKNEIAYQIRLLRTGQGQRAKSENVFTQKCPDSECRGFLSTAWKCGLCSKWACAECHEIKGLAKDAHHVCKPDVLATAKLLAKDSRGCPGCGTLITKIEGCDQMWCTQCNTAFSWRTGQKETGVIHNPHYYDYQRRVNGGVAPRALGDVQCGGIPHYSQIRAGVRELKPKEQELFLSFHRIVNHVQHVEIARMHNVFNQMDNEDLRIDYLLGHLSKEQIKVSVQQREKKREKERAVRRALEVLVQAGTDLLNRVMAETVVAKKAALLIEIDGLRKFVNELMAKIHDRLKLSVPQYNSSWHAEHPFSPTAKKAKLEKEKEEARKARQRALDAEATTAFYTETRNPNGTALPAVIVLPPPPAPI